MMCDRIREQLADFLAGRLDAARREALVEHLETCSACRAEAAELGVVWRGLEAMQEPEPSPAMRARFMETLRAYQEGYQHGQRKPVEPPRPAFWSGWFPAQPVWQGVFAALLMIAGLAAGRYVWNAQSAAPVSNPQIAQLQGQVDSLRQLVALSLLNEQSPAERLRGVTYSHQVSNPDKEVRQALLRTVTQDSNVNVRLSAVDALARFSGDADVRRGLISALQTQDSPLVQIALIDLIVQMQAKDGASTLRQVAQSPQADQDVRNRAASALEKLEAFQ